VCVCVFVRVCVCVCVCECARVSVHMHASMRLCVFASPLMLVAGCWLLAGSCFWLPLLLWVPVHAGGRSV